MAVIMSKAITSLFLGLCLATQINCVPLLKLATTAQRTVISTLGTSPTAHPTKPTTENNPGTYPVAAKTTRMSPSISNDYQSTRKPTLTTEISTTTAPTTLPTTTSLLPTSTEIKTSPPTKASTTGMPTTEKDNNTSHGSKKTLNCDAGMDKCMAEFESTNHISEECMFLLLQCTRGYPHMRYMAQMKAKAVKRRERRCS